MPSCSQSTTDPKRRYHDVAYAGRVSLSRLWREDNDADERQHEILMKLQGCNPSRAKKSWAREQARQRASKNRQWLRLLDLSTDPDAIVDAASDALAVPELLAWLPTKVAEILFHHFLRGSSIAATAKAANVSRRTVTRVLANLHDIAEHWFADRIRRKLSLVTKQTRPV